MQNPFENISYPEDPNQLFSWAREFVSQLRLVAITAEAPVGTIMPFAGSVIPDGWLACEGQVLSAETFPALWRNLGTRWNEVGDAAGTFRLPDGRGRTFMGSEELYGGEASTVLTQAKLPNVNLTVTDPGHTHAFSGAPHTHSISDPGHTHAASGSPAMAGGNAGVAAGDTMVGTTIGGALTLGQSATGVAVQNATAGGANASAPTGISVALGGSDEALELVPPFFGGTWIIKVD